MQSGFTARLDPVWLTRQRTTQSAVLAPKIDASSSAVLTPPIGAFVKICYDAAGAVYQPSVHNLPKTYDRSGTQFAVVEDAFGQTATVHVNNLQGQYRVVHTGDEALAVGDHFYVTYPERADVEAQLSSVKLPRTQAACPDASFPLFGGLFATKRFAAHSIDLLSHRLKRDLETAAKAPANAVPNVSDEAFAFFTQMMYVAVEINACLTPAMKRIVQEFKDFQAGAGPSPSNKDMAVLMTNKTLRNMLCESADRMVALYDAAAAGTYGKVLYSVHTPTPLFRSQVMLNNKMGKIECGSAFQAYLYKFNGV